MLMHKKRCTCGSRGNEDLQLTCSCSAFAARGPRSMLLRLLLPSSAGAAAAGSAPKKPISPLVKPPCAQHTQSVQRAAPPSQ